MQCRSIGPNLICDVAEIPVLSRLAFLLQVPRFSAGEAFGTSELGCMPHKCILQ